MAYHARLGSEKVHRRRGILLTTHFTRCKNTPRSPLKEEGTGRGTSCIMTATALTFRPDSLMADHVSSRARDLKRAVPAAANALTSMELLARAKDRYEAALERLQPADREAIVARIELGLPYAEVAAALRKPSIAAAHVAVSRALVKLAKEMSRGRRS